MRLIHDRIADRAAGAPDDVAVSWRDSTVSYRELERRANQLAAWLTGRGAVPERTVGICLPRTPDLAVAILAVLKAGAAYLPMDPALPRNRRDFMTRDADALLVLTESLLFRQRDEIGGQPETRPAAPVRPGNLAYVMYTSGSTGTPKGVLVQHDQLAAYLDWAVERYLPDGGGAALHTPVNFDLSVTSLLAPLVAGRSVRLLPIEDPPISALPAALADGRLSFVKLTPAHLALLADVATPEALAAVPRVVVGGEALTYSHLAAWRRHAPDAWICNEYGPTEAVVGCCTYEFTAGEDREGPVPIGRATPGTHLAVLDERGAPVADGELGELHIGGDQVTRGYHGRPGLTATRFVPDPAHPSRRLYRTGDLVRRSPDGTLVYVGRRDSQVKLRGYRIELGEIETVLSGHPAVAAAAVAVRGRDAGRRLVGYLVPRAGRELDPETVRAHAADALPAYMVPSAFVTLPALPLSTGGKVDRDRLPEPPSAAPAPAPSDPAGDAAPYETEVTAVFAEVLGAPVTAYDADFVGLGGTSLQISQVIGRLARDHGVDLPAEAWLRSPTVSGIAALIDTYLRDGPAAAHQSVDDRELDFTLDDDILSTLDKESSSVLN